VQRMCHWITAQNAEWPRTVASLMADRLARAGRFLGASWPDQWLHDQPLRMHPTCKPLLAVTGVLLR